MKLIIDIPEETLNEIKDNVMFTGTIPSEILWDVTNAIVNSTLLPKEYGRLIILSEKKLKENQIDLDFSCQKWISDVSLSDATVAIIEADKKRSKE